MFVLLLSLFPQDFMASVIVFEIFCSGLEDLADLRSTKGLEAERATLEYGRASDWGFEQLEGISMRHAVFMQFWAGAQALKSVGCQKQKPISKVSGAVGWLHDTAFGVIFEYIPNSVFLFASFNRSIVSSFWLIPCQSGQPARTAMKRSVIFLHMGKELRCYNVKAQPFRASARCFLLYLRASTFFDNFE